MTRRRFHRRVYLGILRRQNLLCCCGCGEKLTRAEGYQFDHEHDLALGGPDTPENLRALRTPCHVKKSRKGAAARAKTKRLENIRLHGLKVRRGRTMRSRGFQTRLRRRMSGVVEVRT